MPDVAREQLLITLVPGTWGRGLCPRLRRRGKLRWWEEGSPFLMRLCVQLGDLPTTVTPLLWTCANSIDARDKAAHALAEHLAAERAAHPRATQLIIAHSHGGNIALRAVTQLRGDDASSGADRTMPLVVMLATPFVEVHPADRGNGPRMMRYATILAISALLWVPLMMIMRSDSMLYIAGIIALMLVLLAYWYWPYRGSAKRRDRLERLSAATRLGEIGAAEARRCLVIRAIDDEASLLMALGTILNYVTIWITLCLALLYPVLVFLIEIGLYRLFKGGLEKLDIYHNIARLVSSGSIAVPLGVFMLARTVHGWELATSPMDCQINTQSTPDSLGLSKIVTLVRRTYMKSLHHKIYDHEDCTTVISDWVRAQLSLPSARPDEP